MSTSNLTEAREEDACETQAANDCGCRELEQGGKRRFRGLDAAVTRLSRFEPAIPFFGRVL
jgi:hypothetical protein